MERSDLPELQYILPIANLPTVARVGILSHRIAAKLPEHESVADSEVQDIRAKRGVPGGRPLHDYANLYVCARNPMMYRRRGFVDKLCVLRVSTSVLDLPGVVVTDGNAASEYSLFRPAPGGLRMVNQELTFAEYWTHQDAIEGMRRKSAKCAEVLVPNRVSPEYIEGIWVGTETALREVKAVGMSVGVELDGHLFFV